MFDGNDLPHELLLMTRQKTKPRNAFNNNTSADIKLSKAQINKIIQSGGFLGSLLSKLVGPLLKVAVPLAKNVLAPLGITAAASALDAGIQKKYVDLGKKTLIIFNEEMNEIMEIVQALEDSNIFLKGVTKTIKDETKEQKVGFLSMLLGTLGASLFGYLLAGKGIARAGYVDPLQNKFLIPPHPLTNFEIQKYYEDESRFNGVFSRDNLLKKINDGAYVKNLDEHAHTGTHWIALFCVRAEVIYFNSLGVEHIPKEIKEFIGNRNKSKYLPHTSK